jgi:phosphatidylserine/phosphatidylglycerophosphate/cardiolipin synthase-like enzyme
MPYPFELLFDERYREVVNGLLENAQNSIYLALFKIEFSMTSKQKWANSLVSWLVLKNAEGVDVRVLIHLMKPSRVTPYSNWLAAKFLLDSGIPVRSLPRNRVLHGKLLVVDRRHAVFGSHNWSEAALTRNWEVSARVDDYGYVKELEDHFLKAWETGEGVSV